MTNVTAREASEWFAGGKRPREVAFSEHCYGAVVPARRVWWRDGAHPVVFVGTGSHANYPRPVSVPVRQLRCSLGVQPRYRLILTTAPVRDR